MEAGGNTKLIEFLKGHSHFSDPQVKGENYASLALMTYRKILVELAEGRTPQDFAFMMNKAIADQTETDRKAADKAGTYKGFGSALPPTAAEQAAEATLKGTHSVAEGMAGFLQKQGWSGAAQSVTQAAGYVPKEQKREEIYDPSKKSMFGDITKAVGGLLGECPIMKDT